MELVTQDVFWLLEPRGGRFTFNLKPTQSLQHEQASTHLFTARDFAPSSRTLSSTYPHFNESPVKTYVATKTFEQRTTITFDEKNAPKES